MVLKNLLCFTKRSQEKAIKLGYTTQKEIKKQSIISIIVLYLPCFILVPLMVCYINGAREFGDIFIQSLLIMYIMGLFDRFFVDWYSVEHTKAWDIPNTEELKPYIPTKMKIVKWLGTIVGFAIIALIIALIMSKMIENCNLKRRYTELDTKRLAKFLIITFVITGIAWSGLAVLTSLNIIPFSHPLGTILHL